jgi:hypothetical protein
LDEADLLADHIAVLKSPGMLVAQGTPVFLKSQFGHGYTLSVTAANANSGGKMVNELWLKILRMIRAVAPNTVSSSLSGTSATYSLREKDVRIVGEVLAALNREQADIKLSSVVVHATTLDDVFLSLMQSRNQESDATLPSLCEVEEKSTYTDSLSGVCHLTNGRSQTVVSQAITIFFKRCLIARRNWLTPLFALLIAVAGSCVPLLFIDGRETKNCSPSFNNSVIQSLYLPNSQILQLAEKIGQPGSPAVVVSPPGLLETIGLTQSEVLTIDVPNNATFVQGVQQHFTSLAVGGISMNLSSGESLVAWNAFPPGTYGLILLNAVSNVLFNRALNASQEVSGSPAVIAAGFQSFPGADALGDIIKALRWTMFYGAAMVRVDNFAVDLALIRTYLHPERISCDFLPLCRAGATSIRESDAVL